MDATQRIVLDLDGPALDHVFRVAPLVVVGTREEDGAIDLAPKHMVTPVGERHLAFVCTPDHAIECFLGTEMDVVAWSELIGSGPVNVDFLYSTNNFPNNFFSWRPALQTPATRSVV